MVDNRFPRNANCLNGKIGEENFDATMYKPCPHCVQPISADELSYYLVDTPSFHRESLSYSDSYVLFVTGREWVDANSGFGYVVVTAKECGVTTEDQPNIIRRKIFEFVLRIHGNYIYRIIQVMSESAYNDFAASISRSINHRK